jgi:hypothetical protein
MQTLRKNKHTVDIPIAHLFLTFTLTAVKRLKTSFKKRIIVENTLIHILNLNLMDLTVNKTLTMMF